MGKAFAARGFTLLELLIAVAIFALLSLGTYRMLESVMRSDEATRAQELALRELARGFWSLERDLLQVSPRKIRDAYGDERALFLGESKSLDGDAAFEFTRSGWRNPTGVQRSQLQRVRWRLAGETLERVYWVVLDQAQDSQPRVQKVLSGVTALELRYRDKEGQWHDDWPPQGRSPGNGEQGDGGGLPQAVELNLEHQRYGKLVRLLRLPDEAAANPIADIPQDPNNPDNPADPDQPQQPPTEPPPGQPGGTKL